MDRQEIIRIEYSDGVRTVIDELTRLARSGAYVYRGYNRQDELLPNIIRDRVNYVDVETDLLKDFERFGSHYFHANTPIDFMSYAQHFGLPTRLLDFTYNPFIALSFALHGPKSNATYKAPDDKDYYYIRFASTEENILLHTIPVTDDIYNTRFTRTDSLAVKACHCIDSVTDLFGNNSLNRNAMSLISSQNPIHGIDDIKAVQSKINNRTILFIDPNQSNQRIIMQQGLFMFPYTLQESEHLNILKTNSSVIMIHKDLRRDLLAYLDTLGFNAFRLMPDLVSICKAVTQKVKDERSEKNTAFKKRGAK